MWQIHSNLYSCSAKLLWVFKLTVMFSNWNINLFRPLIWSPQWRITKYFIVSDLLKLYNQLLLLCTFYSWCWEWGSLSLSPVGPRGCSQGLARGSQVSLRCQQHSFFMSPFPGIPTNSVVWETDASLMRSQQDFVCLVLAVISYTKFASFFLPLSQTLLAENVRTQPPFHTSCSSLRAWAPADAPLKKLLFLRLTVASGCQF